MENKDDFYFSLRFSLSYASLFSCPAFYVVGGCWKLFGKPHAEIITFEAHLAVCFGNGCLAGSRMLL